MARTILISGANGLIGSALVAHFRSRGDKVARLVRNQSDKSTDTLFYSYESELNNVEESGAQGSRPTEEKAEQIDVEESGAQGSQPTEEKAEQIDVEESGAQGSQPTEENTIEQEQFDQADVIIHLGGAPIAGSLWTKTYKQKLYNSRIKSTRFISKTITRASNKRRLLIVASAVGIYGDRGDEVLDETSSVGDRFLAQLCNDWEEEAYTAQSERTRVVTARIGLVLSPRGGFLSRMLPLFKFGLGGRMGDGKQYMSWITLSDVVGAIEHVIENENIKGPVNIVGPEPLTNREFTMKLASALRRPAIFTQPGWLLKLLPGEMAQEMLLSSTRVLPKRLDVSGFVFEYKNLNEALLYALKDLSEK